MPEYTLTVRQPALARQVCAQPSFILHAGVEFFKQQRIVLLNRRQFLGERELEPIQHLPKRGIRVA